jgi:CorA-like Mg2+ transporter protein
MFNDGLRDKLLFEDKDFTYSRRYFWAFQTLGTMNQSIKAMVDAYEDTFTESVWEGKHPTLWPLTGESSGRNTYWLKKMSLMKKDFGHEVDRLKGLVDENESLRKEIRDLRENLFSGTSVLESRKSVEQTEITVQQGQNIKLLTLVNMFFLPLTFVTSVFGMTNMPQEASFWRFGVVMVTVCVPFFLLIGSMNTSTGMRFWQEHLRALMRSFGSWLTWWRQSPRLGSLSNSTSTESSDPKLVRMKERSLSATEGIQERTAQFANSSDEPNPHSTPLKRAISFGPPISSQSDVNPKKDSNNQDEIEVQGESLILQAPQLAVIRESGDAMDEVPRATGAQRGGNLAIWDKFKGGRGTSSREYNV